MTLCKILDLDIPVDDRIWAVTHFLQDRENRLFAADCAESVLYLFEKKYPDNKRPRDAIYAARKYANGEISAGGLAAARDAAWAAAWAAARDAAWAAAWAAAWDAAWAAARDAAGAAAGAAARAAAWAAARDAAWDAARAAARDAEQQKHLDNLRTYCEGL
jgi:hypothetical protein